MAAFEKTEEWVADWIRQGQFTNVVIVSGAGVSTGSGIPDYRSYSGIFSQLKAQYPDLMYPEDVFRRSFFERNKIATNPVYVEFIELVKAATPTPSHRLAEWLHRKGWLRRVYTQNVDGLYQKAGLPDEVVVEFHGSLTKDNVVFYDEPIPQSAIDQVVIDFMGANVRERPVDLMLVMGTSLQVAPFCAIPNLVPKSCVRVLVDLDPSNAYVNDWTKDPQSPYMSRSYCVFKSGRTKRKVTLRPDWRRSRKWHRQYSLEVDTDEWSQTIYME